MTITQICVVFTICILTEVIAVGASLFVMNASDSEENLIGVIIALAFFLGISGSYIMYMKGWM